MTDTLSAVLDEAAENTMTLRDVLKCYLFLEQRDGVTAFPEEIPDQEAASLYDSPNRLSQHTLNFIRLQNEIMHSDREGILNMCLPAGIEKFFVKAMIMRQMENKEERRKAIERFLKSFEEFCRTLLETFATLKGVEKYHKSLQDDINLQTQEIGADEQFEDIQDDLTRIGSKIEKTRAQLTDKKLESITELNEIRKDLADENTALISIDLRFKERYKAVLRLLNNTVGKAAHYASTATSVLRGGAVATGASTGVSSVAAGVSAGTGTATAAAITQTVAGGIVRGAAAVAQTVGSVVTATTNNATSNAGQPNNPNNMPGYVPPPGSPLNAPGGPYAAGNAAPPPPNNDPDD